MDIMPIIVTLVIIGVLLGLLNWAAPQIKMDPTILRILNVVVIVIVVLWLLSVFVGDVPHLYIGSRR